MNHRINAITFGPEAHHDQIRQIFGHVDNGQHTMFNMFAEELDKVNHDHKLNPEDIPMDYYYFMKLVPHVFVDTIEQEE